MNLKTTIIGLLSIIGAAITYVAIPLLDSSPLTVADWSGFGTAAVTAIGLLFAADGSSLRSLNRRQGNPLGMKRP